MSKTVLQETFNVSNPYLCFKVSEFYLMSLKFHVNLPFCSDSVMIKPHQFIFQREPVSDNIRQ